MHTNSGLVDLDDPKINIHDAVRALGMLCRFNGNCPWFYSVALHSVNVARLVRDQGGDNELVKHALLHDIGEAYVGDLTVPVQDYLSDEAIAEFKNLERRMVMAVYEKLKMGTPTPCEADLVHQADYAVGQAECEYFFDVPRAIDTRFIFSTFSPDDASTLWWSEWRKASE